MKISKKANEKAEYLREMLEAMTGQKIKFVDVTGKSVEVEEDKCNLKGLNKEIQCRVAKLNCDECLKASIHKSKAKGDEK